MGGVVHAQTTTPAPQTSGVSTAPIVTDQTQAPDKIWSIKASVSNSSNLFGDSVAAGGSRENSYLLNPSIQASETINIGVSMLFTHNLLQEQASDFENTGVVGRIKPLVIVKDVLSLKPAISGLVPTNQKSREDESLQGGLGGSLGLGADLKKFRVPLTVDYSFAARRNFHEFIRNDKGTLNNEYRLAQALVFSTTFLRRFSMTSANRLISNIAYSGTTKSAFELSQELGYQINDNVAVSIGHSNAGNTLKADAKSSNLDLINDNTSTLSAGLEVVY